MLGNGPSLLDVNARLLSKYPSFGANTIFRSPIIPTYYTAVDSRVMREFSEEINKRFASIPKFLPFPNLDKWTGENIYRFYHRPGALWPRNQQELWPRDILSSEGITYLVIMNVMMLLAFFMGFETMLMVGVDHNLPTKQHFWGHDDGMGNGPTNEEIAESYRVLREGFAPRKVVNISTYTELSDAIIPRGDWRDWA